MQSQINPTLHPSTALPRLLLVGVFARLSSQDTQGRHQPNTNQSLQSDDGRTRPPQSEEQGTVPSVGFSAVELTRCFQAAAPQQITAEQLLREAYERQDVTPARPKHAILDLEELQEYQGRQRKDFENKIRRNRLRMGEYIRYATWELEQKEYAR